MRAYFIKRIGLLVLTLFGITLVSFLMLQFTPGSPLEMKLSQTKDGGLGDKGALTEEAMEQLKKMYNLDKPVLVRYGLWLKDLATLDFGTSFTDHRPVIDKIKERLPVSLVFGLTSIFIALFIGIPLGLLAARYQSSWKDTGITVATIALHSIPVYVLAIFLLTFFSNQNMLDLFPIYGIQSDGYETLSWWEKILDRAHHFILPCICYTVGGFVLLTQQQRASIIEAMRQDYVRTARAKGVSEARAFYKHAFRNSLIPVVTLLGGLIPAIIGGSVIIERIFSIPGIGLLSFEAILARDYPTIMANFTISAFLSLLGIFMSDLFYVLVDPRITFEDRT